MRPPYTCVYREMWDDERFWSLPDATKLVYLYLLTTPMGNGVGCFKAGMAAMIEESRIKDGTFRKGFRECLAKGLCDYDEGARVVYIPKYFERNPPNNPNNLKFIAKDYLKIPDCSLKAKCYQTIEEWCNEKGGMFPQTFQERYEECSQERPGDSSALSDPLSPSLPLSDSGIDANPKVVASKKPAKGTPTWNAYASAYKERYGTDPVRNTKANSLCVQLVDRLGADTAPPVAAYYLTSNNAYHAGRGHALDALVKDCEKVCTEWKTGNRVTSHQAREGDRLQSAGDMWSNLRKEIADE